MANKFFPNFDEYIVTSPFGPRGNGFHYGIDLVAKSPTGLGKIDKIMAHTGGEVEECGYNNSAGNFIRIRTDENTVMSYCHFREKPSFTKGQIVKQGTILGTMGSTGNSTGAHLHWGIKYKDTWIDPFPHLDKDFVPEEPIAAKQYTTCIVAVLRQGDRGDSVRAMQTLLNMHGFDCGAAGADGIFGKATGGALEKFQIQFGLTVDKICGKETWETLMGV